MLEGTKKMLQLIIFNEKHSTKHLETVNFYDLEVLNLKGSYYEFYLHETFQFQQKITQISSIL